jgi:hypothetical protein
MNTTKNRTAAAPQVSAYLRAQGVAVQSSRRRSAEGVKVSQSMAWEHLGENRHETMISADYDSRAHSRQVAAALTELLASEYEVRPNAYSPSIIYVTEKEA